MTTRATTTSSSRRTMRRRSKLINCFSTGSISHTIILLVAVLAPFCQSSNSGSSRGLAAAATASNDAADKRIVSYVLEPFEKAYDFSNKTTTSPFLLENLDYVFMEGLTRRELFPVLSNDAFVGNTSFQMDYENENDNKDISSYYAVRGTAGDGQVVFPAGPGGGNHRTLSFAYKTSPGSEGLIWRFSLYTQLLEAGGSNEMLRGWQYQPNHTTVTATNPLLLQSNEWQEVEFPLEKSYWTPIMNEGTTTTTTNDDGNLLLPDLHQLKMWQLEFIPSSDDNAKKTSSSSLYLDHLRIIGDGTLLNHNMNSNTLDLGNNENNNNNSNNNLATSVWKAEGDVAGAADVHMYYTYICPSRSYYNLSQAKGVAFDLKHQYYQNNIDDDNEMSLQFRLLDGSNCYEKCNHYNNMENYQASYFYQQETTTTSREQQIRVSLNNADETTTTDTTASTTTVATSTSDLLLPLELSATSGGPGGEPEGILGNQILDTDLIKGYMFLFQIHHGNLGVEGEGDIATATATTGTMEGMASGFIEIGNLTALSSIDPIEEASITTTEPTTPPPTTNNITTISPEDEEEEAAVLTITGNERLVSYVMEPFEAAHDESNVTTPLLDMKYYDPEGELLEEPYWWSINNNDSYVGNASLQLQYNNTQFGREYSYAIVGSAGPFGRVYAGAGANFISFAYKIDSGDDPAGGRGGILGWRFSLYDDADCVRQQEQPQDCMELDDLEGWQFQQDDDLLTLNASDWKVKELSLDPSSWKLIKTGDDNSDGESNGILDLNRLKAWKLEFFPVNTTTRRAVVEPNFFKNSSSSSLMTSSLYLDQLQLIGDGTLLSGGMVEIADYPYDRPQHNATVNTKENRHKNSLYLNYTVEMYAAWGGDVTYTYVCPSRAYYNLSKAGAISYDYHTIRTADPADRSSFRFRLFEVSDCIQQCDNDPKKMENYYAFSPALSQPPGTRDTVELSLDTNATDDLKLTGWYGVLGNEVFDKDLIKGYMFQIQISRTGGELGDLLKGEIEIGNLTALPPSLDSGVEEDQAVCRIEPGIELIPIQPDMQYLDRISQIYYGDCCDECHKNPNCSYGLSSSLRTCILFSHIPPNYFKVPRNRDEGSETYQIFWKDSVQARGTYCDKCLCLPSEGIIDCRDQNLTLIPKFNSTSWQPKVLDLRNNPQLTFLGSEEDSIFYNLTDLRLPRNLAYLSENLLKKMPYIDTISFEEGESWLSNSTSHEYESQLVNAIEDSDMAFSDICCGMGNEVMIPGLLPSQKITFCNMANNTPGVDSIYEEFVTYEGGKRLSVITPRSSFRSEGAESAQKCAEYCHIQSNCYYFSFDSRQQRAENLCTLLETKGTPRRMCCDALHMEDPDLGTPGYVSGRVSKTRHSLDNARVLLDPYNTTLVAHQDNGFTVTYFVSLGAMPLRGAVWVEPRLARTTLADHAIISYGPSKVVLYDNETIVPVTVTIPNAFALADGGNIAITNSIDACDRAFLVDNTCSLDDDLSVSIKVKVPPPVLKASKKESLIPAVAGLAAGLVVAGVAVYFFIQHKRHQADALWKVNPEDLIFAEPRVVLGRGTFGYVLLAEYRGTQVAVKRVIPPKTDDDKKNDGPMYGLDDLEAASPPMREKKPGNMTVSMQSSSSTRYQTKKSKGAGNYTGIAEEAPTFTDGSGKRSIESSWGGPKSLKSVDQDNYATLKKNFISEMRHLSKLRHPCVTTVMGAVISKNSEPMLIMEYMEHGSLYDLLHNETVALDGENILPILRDLTSGLRFLHAAVPQVLHGDLKSQNILVDSRFHAKVADFGLTQKKKLGTVGTPYWMAPEQLRGDSGNNAATDVYAFGIILYELYSRKDPYEGEPFEKVIKKIMDPVVQKRPQVPGGMPDLIKTMMKLCVSEFPGYRPSFEELDNQMKAVSVAKIEPAGRPGHHRRKSTTQRTENLLNEVFPARIAKQLQEGKKVEPEHHDVVTIFFSDIVGFTNLSSVLTPVKVSQMLDRLYLVFDELSRLHEVFKVETIGDSWMGVTNLVQDQPDHAERIAKFALDAVDAAAATEVDIDDPSLGGVKIRVGFHSGPVVASVVGSRNPRYCLFGDTVNTASRMESNSVAGKIQCSEAAHKYLPNQIEQPGCSIRLISRGEMEIKGKGKMNTYFVERSTD